MKTKLNNLTRQFNIAVASIMLVTAVRAQNLFTDDFNTGASAQWSNLRGGWTTTGGVYYATIPNNVPPTFTGLPFILQNFAIDVDINQVADGGIWLRCDSSGTNGVLLVTGGHGWGSGNRGANAGQSLYWHVITPANWSNPQILNEAFNVFTNPGVENVHVRVEVVSNSYSAFINGSTNATTTLIETNNTYSTGHVGLYDFSIQTFDNFMLQIPPGFGPYSLGITSDGQSQATLYWLTKASGWDLESTARLTTPNWSTVTNVPIIVGTNFSVTVSNGMTQQFYRLHKQ